MKCIESIVLLPIFYPLRATKMGQGDRFCTEVMEIKASATTAQRSLRPLSFVSN